MVIISVVTTTKLSPPSRWLATTDPTLPSRCSTVFSVVFLGTVSWKLPLTSADQYSHLNDESFSRSVGDTTRPPPRVCFPIHKRQDCRDSRDSLGTVLSETVATVTLSAPSTVAVACHEQLAHSRTAKTIWSWSPDIHQFPINNPSLDTDGYSPPPLAPRWLVKKTPPPTELHIPATVTTLVIMFCRYYCYQQNYCK